MTEMLAGKMKPTADHSFPDAEVTHWVLTPETLDVKVTDVFYYGQLHGPATIHFSLIRSATAMSYDHEANKWNDEQQVEPLKDICEFHHKCGQQYSLKGFGSKSGKWLAVSVVTEDADISWGCSPG